MPPFFSGPTVPAILALADGSIFSGISIGAAGQTTGEVVFNTAMTGYQEILTDPSYSRQIVTLTYPHIGNTGVNREDVESTQVHAAGLVIKDLPLLVSNFRSTQTLSDYLKAENIVALAGIDTRKLTRILREKGAQNGAIVAGIDCTADEALKLARAFPGLAGMDLAKVVSRPRPPTSGLKPNGNLVAVMASKPMRATTWWRSTLASSTTSCACSPKARLQSDRAAGPIERSRRAGAEPGRHLSLKTVPATRSHATMRLPPAEN